MTSVYDQKSTKTLERPPEKAPKSPEMLQFRRELAGMKYPQQVVAIQPPAPSLVQAKGGVSGQSVHQTAAAGVAGSGGSLPHLDKIQKSFGSHDVSGVSAHVGGAAAKATKSLGADAYATGGATAFKNSPNLHTAAHEAAHVVQQRQGVSLPGGVGSVGDKYEKHADRVADAVVSGKSAEGLLSSSPGGSGGAVQRRTAKAPVQLARTTTPAASGGTGTPSGPPIDMGDVVASVKAFCSSDSIALQKLRDVDNEKYYDGSNPKAAFYRAVGTYINSNPTVPKGAVYNACFNNCSNPYKLKGKKVPASKLSPHLFRTNGFSTWYDYQTLASTKTKYTNLALMGVTTGPAVGELAMKLCRHDLKGGTTPMSLTDTGKPLTPTGRSGWYSTDEVKFSTSSDTNFDGILELNALQPEWFGEGTMSYKVKKSAFTGGTNDLRKPTCYDGMQSSLWMSRNQPGNAFGVTGGGASEFLATDIPLSAVEEMTASLPDEDLLTALKRLQEAAQAHLLAGDPVLKAKYDAAKLKLDGIAPSHPDYRNAKWEFDKLTWALPNLVDEVLRGQDVDLRALMLTKGTEAVALVDSIVAKTQSERANPSNRSRRPTHTL